MTMPTYAFPTKTIESRVRRRLRAAGEVLRKCRPFEGGDLEHLARECGALPPWACIKEN